MQWISWDQSFSLNAKISQQIEQLGQIKVLAIVGPARTGKSFLLNQILDDNIFPISHGTEQCTQGIQVHIKEDMIILDVEGFGRQAPNANFFVLAVLLSSCVLYNNWGVIDEPALAQLSFVSHISTVLTDNEHSASSLLWVLRDFILDLVTTQGEELTSNQYLENSLGPTVEGGNKNNIREIIRNSFPNRQCATLFRPCEEEEDLRSGKNFRPEFKEQLQTLHETLQTMLKTKSIAGSPCNGKTLVQLAEKLVKALNDGQMPNVAGTWEAISERACEEAYQNAIDHFKSGLLGELDRNFPMLDSELQDKLQILKESTMYYYQENAVGHKAKEYKINLKKEMKEKWFMSTIRNSEASENKWNDLLDSLLKSFPSDPTSHLELEVAYATISQEYFAQARGDKSHEIWHVRAIPRLLKSIERLSDYVAERAKLQAEETSRAQMNLLQEKYRALLQKEHTLNSQLNYFKEKDILGAETLPVEKDKTVENCNTDCVIQ